MSERKVKILDVSPDIAMRWLNDHDVDHPNRPVRDRHVKRLAGAMKAGEWMLTAEPIAFCKPYVDAQNKQRGVTLINGQHRLWAVVESGATVPMTVWWGCEHDEFAVIDKNRPRTEGDTLGTCRPDMHDPVQVAGVCGAFGRFGLGYNDSTDRADRHFRHSHYEAILRMMEPEVMAVVEYKKRLKKYALRPVLSALVFAQILNPSMTALIVDQLKDAVGFTDRDPIRALHMYLTEQLTPTSKDSQAVVHHKTCHAISARLRGEHIRTLRITAEGLAYLRDGAKSKINGIVAEYNGGKVPAQFYSPRLIVGESKAA